MSYLKQKSLYSDIVFHGDHSASMSSMGNSPMIGGREFVTKYRNLALQVDYDVHLVYGVFSDQYTGVYNGNAKNITDMDIDNCEKAMTPYNYTNFYDTTIQQLDNQSKRIEKKYNNLDNNTRNSIPLNQFASVVFMILTDGVDNLSIHYNSKILKQKIENHKKIYGANIIFTAANISAIKVGKYYGLTKDECLQMGSDRQYSLEAINCITDACIKQTSGSCDKIMITPLMRKKSFSESNELKKPSIDFNSSSESNELKKPILRRMTTSCNL
jgi:hypothetical protein